MYTVLEAIATANPPYKLTQSEASNFMLQTESLSEAIKKRIPSIYANSGIDYRYSCIPDYAGYLPEFELYPPNWELIPTPTTSDRNQKYQTYATKLALQAAQQVITDAGLRPKEITHLIVVSCTGFSAPGIDIQLIRQLGLPLTIARTMIGFMGCHAAFNGLSTAHAICQSDRQAKVLLVCVELCSLHFQVADTLENTIINAIFADGAAAAILTASQLPTQGQLIYRDGSSLLLEETTDLMNWTIGDTGFLMHLSPKVPEVVAGYLPAYLQDFLARHQLTQQDLDFWAIHPGGRKIIDKIQSIFTLSDRMVADSYEVLRNYGNMSSPTILFILKRILENKKSGSKELSNAPFSHNGIALAFGPGLSIEGCLLSFQ
ncbi:type III polyketide synthase [Pseudanabaena sp. FACHB-1998]|uniref:type III polyketide synthase n=1 Tax=Pseudanabaena sp. FACHB-1998 TaxID=2692858 RepID=UPI00168083C0|nr:type III polyketide synthase [Pseudanabaena sp. FACHB-1998]MBD2175440.1 type III polyketide synthase [Pseudanabaena sp. FACHB-1998]